MISKIRSKLRDANNFYLVGIILLLLNLGSISESTSIKLLTPAYFIFLFLILRILFPVNWSYLVKGNLKWLSFVLLITLVGLLRTNLPNTTMVSTIGTVTMLLLFYLCSYAVIQINILYTKTDLYHAYFKLCISPFLILALINLVLWKLGVSFESKQSQEIGEAVMLSKMGLPTNRVKFPFADGINSFAVINSLMLIQVLIYFFIFKIKRTISLIGILVFSTIILYTDSRSSLIYPPLITILFYLLFYRKYNKKISLIRILPIVFVIGPLLMIGLTTLLNAYGLGEDLSRSDSDLETGNGRFLIWAFSWQEFANFKIYHLFGYGIYGHYKSGASNNWSFIFPKYNSPELVHPHSSILSMAFDYGYLGILVFVVFLKKFADGIYEQWGSNKQMSFLMLCFIVLYIALGISESIFGFYYTNAIYAFLTASVFYFLQLDLDSTQQNTEK